MQSDPLISSFIAVVQAHWGERWAPESALPAPKKELFRALTKARRKLPEDDPGYGRLGDLIVDLTLFIPDRDLDAARPFLTPNGLITNAAQSTEELTRARERVRLSIADHRYERRQLLRKADIARADFDPIGMARRRPPRPKPEMTPLGAAEAGCGTLLLLSGAWVVASLGTGVSLVLVRGQNVVDVLIAALAVGIGGGAAFWIVLGPGWAQPVVARLMRILDHPYGEWLLVIPFLLPVLILLRLFRQL